MATHHVMIDGTSYAVGGGTALTDGTKYQIGGGTTLIDGTAYHINFAPKQFTVHATLSAYTSIIYNGALYSNSPLVTFYVTPGDSIRLVVSPGGTYTVNLKISVDGVEMELERFQGPPPAGIRDRSRYYDFTPTSDVTVTGSTVGSGQGANGVIDVTTQ